MNFPHATDQLLPEFIELQKQHEQLQKDYSEVLRERDFLANEVASLEFELDDMWAQQCGCL